MAFLSVVLELRSIATKAAEIDTIMTTAADMALEQIQTVDEFMAKGGDSPYTIAMPASSGSGFVDTDIFEGVYGLSDRDAIFNKLYNTDQLREVARISGAMRRPLRYYAGSVVNQNLAWYYVPRLAYMGLDLFPSGSPSGIAVRTIKTAAKGGSVVPSWVGEGGIAPDYEGIFQTYGFNTSLKTSGNEEYYNTPVNLGVTYLNEDFLGTIFMNNVDLMMRRKYSANLNSEEGGNGVLKGVTYSDKVTGELSAYNAINNGSFTVLRGAKSPTGMNVDAFKGITPEVDYKVIDMYDSSNDSMLTRLFGTNKGAFASKAEYLRDLDSGVLDPSTGAPYTTKPIVVAKVTFSLDVVVPYYSIIGRDLASRLGGGANNYIDIEPSGTDVPGAAGSRRMVYTRYFAVTP